MRTFQVAMAQTHIEPNAGAANLAHLLHLVGRAADEGARVVLLPEAVPFGWMNPEGVSQAESIPDGQVFRAFAGAARQHGIFLCTGLVERAGDRVFNSAVLISPRGELLLHHRKINELEMAHDLYSLGDRVTVADTELGRIGLMICADGFAPGLAIGHALGLLGAQLILSPCAWAVPPNHDNSTDPYGALWRESYGPICRKYDLWIAACSNVGPIRHGPWTGHRCIGCSMLVAPSGKPAVVGPYGSEAEELLIATVSIPKNSVRHARGQTPVAPSPPAR